MRYGKTKELWKTETELNAMWIRAWTLEQKKAIRGKPEGKLIRSAV